MKTGLWAKENDKGESYHQHILSNINDDNHFPLGMEEISGILPPNRKKIMKYDVFELPDSHQDSLDRTPEFQKVKVHLLDKDRLAIASGTAVLPLLLGVGVFWPHCPMPCDLRLDMADCFTLPTGETMKLKALHLCSGSPPHYDFWVCPP